MYQTLIYHACTIHVNIWSSENPVVAFLFQEFSLPTLFLIYTLKDKVIVTNGKISFSMPEFYIYIYQYISHLLYLFMSVDTLVSSIFLAIINNAAMKIEMCICFQINFFIFFK